MLCPTHNTVDCKRNKYMTKCKKRMKIPACFPKIKYFKHQFMFFFSIVCTVHSQKMGCLERNNKFITEFPVSPHFRMLLLNYLGKIGRKTPLKAAATFSVGWNTFACSESLEKPLNWLLFNYYLTTCLQSSVNK